MCTSCTYIGDCMAIKGEELVCNDIGLLLLVVVGVLDIFFDIIGIDVGRGRGIGILCIGILVGNGAKT